MSENSASLLNVTWHALPFGAGRQWIPARLLTPSPSLSIPADAPLIQGSACVRIKTVECLQSVVHQALEFVAERKCESMNNQSIRHGCAHRAELTGWRVTMRLTNTYSTRVRWHSERWQDDEAGACTLYAGLLVASCFVGAPKSRGHWRCLAAPFSIT